jgi:hypothetical protein
VQRSFWPELNPKLSSKLNLQSIDMGAKVVVVQKDDHTKLTSELNL